MPVPQGPVRPSARNLEAYTRYLRARFLIHQQFPETLRAALQQLRELVEAFPDYALAYSGMAVASCLLCLFGLVSGCDAYPEIKASAERGYAPIRNQEKRAQCWADSVPGLSIVGTRGQAVRPRAQTTTRPRGITRTELCSCPR
jgi:hypothetical protein